MLWVGVFLSLLGSGAVHAAVVAVVLSDDSQPYLEAADAIEASLGSEHTVIRVLSNKLAVSDSALSRAKIMVTVGVTAAQQVAERGGKTPVLAVLVTEGWYRGEGREQLARAGRSTGALVIEQPFARQFRVVTRAFPDAKKIGVLVGRDNARQLAELEKAAAAQQLTLVNAVVDSESNLVSALAQVLADADLLLAVPEPDLLNRNTVQSVLMTSYRYRDPVVGYSKSLSRAGALVSVYSTPKQIGRQAGEIAASLLNGGRLDGLQWPKYFSIAINKHVARSLGINLPSEETLNRDLGGEDD